MDFRISPVSYDSTVPIPKIIHFTLPDKTRIPEAIEANIEHIRSLNPDWNVCIYDDQDIKDFLRTQFKPIILKTYLRINPSYGAARADFFRYCLCYIYGGVYLDVKAHLKASLNEIIEASDSYILSHWIAENKEWGIYPELNQIKEGEYQQWHIIAAPNHPYLRTVILKVIKRIRSYTILKYGIGRLGVVKTTGPVAYTLAINSVRNQYPHRFLNVEECGLCYSIFSKSPIPGAHQSLFGKHYSKNYEPVIISKSLKQHVIEQYLKNCRRYRRYKQAFRARFNAQGS